MSWKSMGFKTYQEYLQSYLWKSKSKFMLELFPKCYKCDGRATQVHHKNYKRVCNEGIRDLVTLCRKCYKGVHDETRVD